MASGNGSDFVCFAGKLALSPRQKVRTLGAVYVGSPDDPVFPLVTVTEGPGIWPLAKERRSRHGGPHCRCSVAVLCGGGGHLGDAPPAHRCHLSTDVTSCWPEPQCHPGFAGSSKMLRRGTDFQPRVTVCKDIGSGWHIGSPVVLGIHGSHQQAARHRTLFWGVLTPCRG